MSRNAKAEQNAPLIERLKPCPFCGYEWPTLRQDHGKYWGVTCEKCGLYVMIHPSGAAEIKERMIDKWNRRTASAVPWTQAVRAFLDEKYNGLEV